MQLALEKYARDVVGVYADSYVRDAVLGGAVRMAANHRILEAAKAAHAVEVERIRVSMLLSAVHSRRCGKCTHNFCVADAAVHT